jgi:N-acetylglutamate synthase-like GNAT family acetyltransferase
MSQLEQVQATEGAISAVRGLAPGRTLKRTTALWLPLPPRALPTVKAMLELQPVIGAEDWDAMFKLRMDVETALGIRAPDRVRSMIDEIRACQAELASQWYLARRKTDEVIVGEVGLVRFQTGDLKLGRLQDVDIAPIYQKQSLGTALLNSIVSLAIVQDLSALCLKADTADWPLQWYQRYGFKAVGDWLS